MRIDTYPVGLLLVPGWVAATLVGLALVRRSLHRRDLPRAQEVASYLFAAVGTLYAVILGLIVVDSMTKFAEARLTVEAEANALADVVLFATQLPGEDARRVRELAREYIRSATQEEWPEMARGAASAEARSLAVQLSRAILGFEPATGREEVIFGAQVDAATRFWDGRRTRLMIASEGGLPALQWLVLLAGGAITVVFTYFFKVDDLRVQMALTGMLSAVIALNLYLILMFASPFSGDVAVRPDGFEAARHILGEAGGG